MTLLVLDGDTAGGDGCGATLAAAPETEWEVKRVYVADDYRGRGLSKALMLDLHERAIAPPGCTTMVLQTGGLQPAAHGLYESSATSASASTRRTGSSPASGTTAQTPVAVHLGAVRHRDPARRHRRPVRPGRARHPGSRPAAPGVSVIT